MSKEVLLNVLKMDADEEIYFHPNPGNAGDALINVGCYDFFNNNNINYKDFWWEGITSEEASGRTIVLGGGGGFVPTWSFTRNFVQKYHKNAKQLILLPQTISGNEDLLKELSSNVTIFLREEISYKHVKKYVNSDVKVYLSDDMAFHVDINRALKFNDKDLNLKYTIKSFLASATSFFAKKRNGKVLDAFRNDAERTDIVLSPHNYDVSVPFSLGTENETQCRYTVSRFLKFLNNFDVVRSNRLHVSVGSALLGKKVEFYSNNYYKCRAVYAYSMKDKFNNVNWVDK